MNLRKNIQKNFKINSFINDFKYIIIYKVSKLGNRKKASKITTFISVMN